MKSHIGGSGDGDDGVNETTNKGSSFFAAAAATGTAEKVDTTCKDSAVPPSTRRSEGGEGDEVQRGIIAPAKEEGVSSSIDSDSRVDEKYGQLILQQDGGPAAATAAVSRAVGEEDTNTNTNAITASSSFSADTSAYEEKIRIHDRSEDHTKVKKKKKKQVPGGGGGGGDTSASSADDTAYYDEKRRIHIRSEEEEVAAVHHPTTPSSVVVTSSSQEGQHRLQRGSDDDDDDDDDEGQHQVEESGGVQSLQDAKSRIQQRSELIIRKSAVAEVQQQQQQRRQQQHMRQSLPGAVRVGGGASTSTAEEEDAYDVAGDNDRTAIMAVAREVQDDEDDGRGNKSRRIVAVEYDPDAQEEGRHEGTSTSSYYRPRKRFRLYVTLALVVVVAIVIGVTVGLLICIDGTPATNTGHRESLGIEATIQSVVGGEVLQDPNSPYSRALEWIAFHDPMQLTPDDAPNFIQRYIAAYFYFSTTHDGPWGSCNPPEEKSVEDGITLNTTAAAADTTFCTLSRLKNVEPAPIYASIPANMWLSNISECDWAGLGCDGHSQVISIDLSGVNLSGPFPEGIYNWPFLNSINLLANKLVGPLPAKPILVLRHLTKLFLGYNRFTGSIPKEWWMAPQLRRLSLSNNTITGSIPSEVGNLYDLKQIAFKHNRLTGVLPTELGNLNSISQFDVSQNKIQGQIPIFIRNWKLVDEIQLHHNQISGPIPSSIGELYFLKKLKLDNNPLLSGSLPDSLFDLPTVRILDLYDCSFSGTLSSRIGNLVTLQVLRISNNKLYGSIPSELTKLHGLYKLWVHGNAFYGTIPPELCSNKPLRVDHEFKADCAPNDNYGGNVEVNCTCCTYCCKLGGSGCHPVS